MRAARDLERLASGSRINRSGDDAPGLAIGNGLEAARHGMLQAIRNINDAGGYLSTAEGALGVQTEIIQRMRELAIQSSNGTLGQTDRGHLETEFQQLAAEFDRSAKQTEFNGTNLLDGSMTTIDVQVGTLKGETLGFGLAGTRLSDVFGNAESELVTTTTPLGTFTQTADMNADGNGVLVTVGDFDEDGNLDFLSNEFGTAEVHLYSGNGDGTFADTVIDDIGFNGGAIATGDFDNDGHSDYVGSFFNNILATRVGNGDGTFSEGGTFGYYAESIDVADLNGDGNTDIVTSDGPKPI